MLVKTGSKIFEVTNKSKSVKRARREGGKEEGKEHQKIKLERNTGKEIITIREGEKNKSDGKNGTRKRKWT